MGKSFCLVNKCGKSKKPHEYMCKEHWYMLPKRTRTELQKKDEWATWRLKLFFRAVHTLKWPLQEIVIEPLPHTFKVVLQKLSEV